MFVAYMMDEVVCLLKGMFTIFRHVAAYFAVLATSSWWLSVAQAVTFGVLWLACH
jgi:hypothetical protein